ADIAMVEPVTTIVERIERAMAKPLPSVDKDVLVGMVSGPDKSVSKAIEFYFENIVPDVLCYKSEDQKRRWKNKRRASIVTFVEICGDLSMSEITREHAQKLHSFWMKRIAPEKGPPTHTASSGNRDMSNLRTLYAAW